MFCWFDTRYLRVGYFFFKKVVLLFACYSKMCIFDLSITTKQNNMHYFTTTIEDDNANDILVNVTYSWEEIIDNQGREHFVPEVHSVCDAEGNEVKLPYNIYDLCEQDYIDSADERRLSVAQFQEFLMQ